MRGPAIAALALGLLLAVGLWELPALRSEYSVEQFFPTGHELLTSHDRITKTFRLNQSSPYLFVIESRAEDAWLRPEAIQSLRQLSQELAGRADVAQVFSLTSVEGASQEGEGLVVGNLFERVERGLWRGAIQRDPILGQLLVTPDFRATLLAVEPKGKTQHERARSLEAIKVLIHQRFPHEQLLVAGVPTLQARLSQLIQSELVKFLACATGLFCLLFAAVFRSPGPIFCAFAVLALCNIIALGTTAALGVPLNALMVTLPIIVSVSVISLLIHTFHLWAHRRPTGSYRARWAGAFAICHEIALPNALGILTTALGFLALAPSAIPLISQYGLIVALVLGVIALAGHLCLLLALPVLKTDLRPWVEHSTRWQLWALEHAKLVVFVGALLILTLPWAQRSLNFSARLFDDLPRSDVTRQGMERVDRDFGGVITLDLEGTSEKPKFWQERAHLLRLQRTTAELRKWQGVSSALSASDLFGDNLPATQAGIAESFFLFSMAGKNPLDSYLTVDGQHVRLALRTQDIPAMELDRLRAQLRSYLGRQWPEVRWSEGGLGAYAHAINSEVAQGLIRDFWQPLVLIGLALIPLFGSLRWALLACVPNLVPPAALLLTMALSGTEIRPGIAVVFAIALGFAFNNTLYFLNRLRLLEQQKDPEALAHAVAEEAMPCLLESLIMFIGFATFLVSAFHMNQTFGGFMLISIVAGYAADLVLLPAVIQVLPKLSPKRLAAGLTAALALSAPAFAAMDAKQVLQASQKQLDAKDDQARVQMKIIEENGEVKERSLSLKTLRAEGFSILARIEAPADIKDMAFLGHVNPDGDESQHIYLPSSGQVRRLVTGKSKGGLLGSEIHAEDLNSQAIKSASAKLLKGDARHYAVEITPAAGSSEYTRVVTKISKSDMLPQSTEYFVGAKLKKTVEFKDYRRVGPVWRAHQMNVKNHLNGRGTEVRLSAVEVNAGLKAQDFTEGSLKED